MDFTYFEFTPEHRKKFVMTATAVDPAGGQKEHEFRKGIRDWCCIVSAGRTRDGHIDIFDVKLTRRVPEEQIDLALDVYAFHRTRKIGIEEVMFKNLYAPSMSKAARERKLYPMIMRIKQPKTNKVSRILGIQPLIADEPAVVRFAQHLITEVPEYFAMFDEFPTTFDDGPDATEMVIRMLETPLSNRGPQGVGGTSYWKRSA